MTSYLAAEMRKETRTDFMESTPSLGIEFRHAFLCHEGIKSNILDMSSNTRPKRFSLASSLVEAKWVEFRPGYETGKNDRILLIGRLF